MSIYVLNIWYLQRRSLYWSWTSSSNYIYQDILSKTNYIKVLKIWPNTNITGMAVEYQRPCSRSRRTRRSGPAIRGTNTCKGKFPACILSHRNWTVHGSQSRVASARLHALMCERVHTRAYASGHFRSTLTLSLPPNALRWWHLEAETHTLVDKANLLLLFLPPQVLTTTQDWASTPLS